MSKFFVVATPIGNLEDISQRALKILASVSLIACEDTRQTLKLLNYYKIKNKLFSYHSYNEKKMVSRIIEVLKNGDDVALVTDSGTPTISDPGCIAVKKVREAGFSVVPIPGPCAATALLSASGINARGIVFIGFLSSKKEKRRNQLRKLLAQAYGFILYESPFRILGLLEDLKFLAEQRLVCLGRELTKIYEEILYGTAEELLTILQKRPNIKGEICLLVEPEKNIKEITGD